jgi:plastocyanin domain-containing protein
LVQAAAVMGLFALGTAPGLMGVGAISALAKGRRAPAVLSVIGVVVIGFAVVNLNGALTSLGVTTVTKEQGNYAARSANVTDTSGGQQAEITVEYGYNPNNTVVYADQPTTLVFTAHNLGCDSIVDVHALGVDEPIYLQRGQTNVTIPALKPGQYHYTCSMGMFRSTITAITPPSLPDQSP